MLISGILFWAFILVVSIFLLIKSSDYLTYHSVVISEIMHIPRFVIGATIIAIGTSLPEIITSMIAIFNEENITDFVASTVVGSNIANIGLVIGISAFISREAVFKKKLITVDIPLLFIATALFVLTATDGLFTFAEAIILLMAYAVFMLYYLKGQDPEDENGHEKEKMHIKHVLWIIGGSIGIYLGAEWTIKALLELAKALPFSISALSLSVVAIGTSLPEIVVSTRATMKGHYDVAMGNIFGSNMFNTLAIMGLLGLFKDLEISAEVLEIGIPFLIAITVAALFVKIDNKVTVWEGSMLLLMYALFIGKLFAFI